MAKRSGKKSSISVKSKKMSRKKKKTMRVVVVVVALVLIVSVVGGGWWVLQRVGIVSQRTASFDPQWRNATQSASGQAAMLLPTPVSYETDTGFYGLTKIGGETLVFQCEVRDDVPYLSINGYEMVLVNKEFFVPRSYGNGATSEAQAAYDAMIGAAAAAGYSLELVSGYRSYDIQDSIHSSYLNSGQYSYDYVKEMSAEPGHSEHQLGLAFDISDNGNLYKGFGDTDAGRWLAEHAAEYGFILRYPDGKTWATGYMYEPWHFRYVGVELAQIIFETGLTVEEIVGRPAGTPPVEQ